MLAGNQVRRWRPLDKHICVAEIIKETLGEGLWLQQTSEEQLIKAAFEAMDLDSSRQIGLWMAKGGIDSRSHAVCSFC